MVKLMQRLCYLCHVDGELVPAVATYETECEEYYDVCAKHLKRVKKAGLDNWEIDDAVEEHL